MDLFSKLKNLKLLIIDDDEWVRDSLRMYFESEGCNTLALETAEEGLKVLKKQDFNIIIIDDYYPNGQSLLSYLQTISESDQFELKVKGPILAGLGLALSATSMVAIVKVGRRVKEWEKRKNE